MIVHIKIVPNNVIINRAIIPNNHSHYLYELFNITTLILLAAYVKF